MNTRIIIAALASGLCLSMLAVAQDKPSTPPVTVAAKAAAPASPGKEAAPAPITQAEKDKFHRTYTEYLETQTQLLSLRSKFADQEKDVQALFSDLAKRCVAPKVFDRLAADCQDPPKPQQ